MALSGMMRERSMLRLEDIRLTARKWPSMKKWKDAPYHKVLERFDKYTCGNLS